MRARPCLVGLILVALCPRPAFAQAPAPLDKPLVEIFGGFSSLPGDGDDFPRLTTSRGFQVTADVNIKRWLAVFGDFAGQWSTVDDLGPSYPGVVADTRVYEVLFGPRFRFEAAGRLRIFAHALVGVSSGHTNIGFSDSGFTMGGGGGADFDLTRRVAVRLQIDLLGSFADIVESNERFAIGAVVRLGGS